jgi:hypothetical protein
MKSSSKYPKFVFPFAVTLALAAVTLAAKPPNVPHKHGTDILHFFVRKAMNNEGVVRGASGAVNARQNQQGHANNQTLDIAVKDLGSSTDYQLLALIDNDTNYTKVANFSTDAKGQAKLSYRALGNGHGGGSKSLPLPNLLNPVSLLRVVAIFNANTQAVLTADLTNPDKLTYLIKRDMSSNAVSASLRIMANQKKTQFRMDTGGLSPSGGYLLVLNGGVADTFTADDKGRLRIDSPMALPTEILDLRSVALWDSSSNVVVTTTLP